MSRTLGELALGTSVWIDEYPDGVQTPTEYYVMEHTGQATQLLRKNAYIAKRMNATNQATYAGCEMDAYLLAEDGFRAIFDAATRAALMSTTIRPIDVDGEPKELARDIYVPTAGNVGASTTEGTSWLPVLKEIAGTTNDNTARICYNQSGAAIYWWVSSACSESQFRSVSNYGGLMDNYSATNSGIWLRPALSVASATIVSPDGEDVIYLLSDASKEYREVKATIKIGESEKRPKAARLFVESENMVNEKYELANNAGDAEPVWIEATPGETVELTNTVKETERWIIGVRMYGKSNGRGILHEPTVLVEAEA